MEKETVAYLYRRETSSESVCLTVCSDDYGHGREMDLYRFHYVSENDCYIE